MHNARLHVADVCTHVQCGEFGTDLRLHDGNVNCVIWSCSSSEIVATRSIKSGEEILIDYYAPPGVSLERQRRLFRKQHLWPLAAQPNSAANAGTDDAEAQQCSSAGAAACAEVEELEQHLDGMVHSVHEVCFASGQWRSVCCR